VARKKNLEALIELYVTNSTHLQQKVMDSFLKDYGKSNNI
jgi:hypothetical protein